MTRRWKTPEERLIRSLKDPKAGIKDHLSFLRSLKRDLKRQRKCTPHPDATKSRTTRKGVKKKKNCNKDDKTVD